MYLKTDMFLVNKGFTLIELTIVVFIFGILAAIATPIYQNYGLRANASAAEQAISEIAIGLNKHKSRNFSFKGFSISPNPMVLPINSTGSNIKYEITVRDGNNTSLALTDSAALGQQWVIRAESKDARNYTYLFTSNGLRCRNKLASSVTYATCGTGANVEKW
ncbi:prepilin-type N-terminal cleavage/methylation domain-containing protein [Acinetobacter cumulans]|uniref:Prepilin-type N-terminal cleavage/methylation domain-containing protein n=1 Tax=Acinetobacter cumulans TaxID=2136182 RepID=A0A3A8GI20_9GAMM|nr:prepilin-type N-terminal cleavage/methylation domain-containing protein [Acinetobacter cumulans]RKG54704.1 prepilin-type N-terminal cleavage/methylation domain-containing protein [Acinetobacter cumulans]